MTKKSKDSATALAQAACPAGHGTYDFIGESPRHEVKHSQKKRSRKATGESLKMRKEKNSKFGSKQNKVQSETRKAKATNLNKVMPKTSRPASKSLHNEVVNSAFAKQRCKRSLKPIPLPNLDDISPIATGTKQTKKTRSKTDKPIPEKRRLRSSDFSLESPKMSFIASNTPKSNENDSAISVSPRKAVPRFGAEKTSTPVSVAPKAKSKTKSNLRNNVLKSKPENTSTPKEESRPTKTFSRIKDKLPAVGVSPVETVERMETPTSDYASMDCIETPSPFHSKAQRRKRASSPAFTLDDATEHSECLQLNKSVDKMYKKSRRKYEHHSKRSESKLDEWADKMNCEFEDIENFELSVEG